MVKVLVFSPYDNDYVIISEHQTFCFFITTDHESHAEQDAPVLNLIRAKIYRETLRSAKKKWCTIGFI